MANATKKFKKIAIIHPNTQGSTKVAKELYNYFTPTPPETSDLIIVIGGDGSMLHALHHYMDLNIPFYGINSGSVGFLMNNFHIQNFSKNIDINKEIIDNIKL